MYCVKDQYVAHTFLFCFRWEERDHLIPVKIIAYDILDAANIVGITTEAYAAAHIVMFHKPEDININ
jgi:hypothetical protein